MKQNQDNKVNITVLKQMEPIIKELLKYPNVWKTLDVDYFPPRVERLYTIWNGYRIHLHVIHPTDQPCLMHKHRWPSAMKLLKGSYEMGLAYWTHEIAAKNAFIIPILSKLLLTAGSYYEMTQTDTLHYVKPTGEPSYSIMITCDLYPEAYKLRQEQVTKELQPLSNPRKIEILNIFKKLTKDSWIKKLIRIFA